MDLRKEFEEAHRLFVQCAPQTVENDTGIQDGLLKYFNEQTKLTDSYAEREMEKTYFDFRETLGVAKT